MEKTIHNFSFNNMFYDAFRKTIVLLGLMVFAVNGWAEDITPGDSKDPLSDYFKDDHYDFSKISYSDIESKFSGLDGTFEYGVYTYTDPGSDEEDESDDTEYTIDYTSYTCWVSETEYDNFSSFSNRMKVVEFSQGEEGKDPLFDYYDGSRYDFVGEDLPSWLSSIEDNRYTDEDSKTIYTGIDYNDYDCWVDKDDYNDALDEVFKGVYQVVSFEPGGSYDLLAGYYNSSGEYDFTKVTESEVINDIFTMLSNVSSDGEYTDEVNMTIYTGINYSTSYSCRINDASDYSNFDSYFDNVYVIFKAGNSAQDPFSDYYVSVEDDGYYDFTKINIDNYTSIKEILDLISENTWNNGDHDIYDINYSGYKCLMHGYYLTEFETDFRGLGFNITKLRNEITQSENESEKNVPNVQYDNAIENLYIVDFAELEDLSSVDDINSGYSMLSDIARDGGPTVKNVTYSRNLGDGANLQWITMCLPFAYTSGNVTIHNNGVVHSQTGVEGTSFNMFKFDGKYEGDEVLDIEGTEYSEEANTMMFVPIESDETVEAGEAILICTDATSFDVVVNDPTFESTPDYGDMPETQEDAQNYNYYFRGCLSLNDGEDKATDLTPEGFSMYKVSPTVNYVSSSETSKVWVTDTDEPSEAYVPTEPTGKETDDQFKQEIKEKYESENSNPDNRLEVLGVTITSKEYSYDIEYYPMTEETFDYPYDLTGDSSTKEELTEERAKEIFSQYIAKNPKEKAEYKDFESSSSDDGYSYTIKYDAVGSSTQTDTYSDSEPSLDSYLNSMDGFGKLYESSLTVSVYYELERKYLSESADGAQSYEYIAAGTLLRCLDNTDKGEEFDSWIYPNRCYLVLPSSITGVDNGSDSGAKLRMVVKWSDASDEVVAIEDLAIDENGNLAPKPKSGAIYSITGTLVNKSGNRSALVPGLYIQGGKKFVVR